MSLIATVIEIQAEAQRLGRKEERDDIIALLRSKANEPSEFEDWARWAEQLADVLEEGRHEGYAKEHGDG